MKGILREMFQLERGDLDFGLYRIMALKAGEIEAFLDRDLLPQVRRVLKGVSDEERVALDKELVEARRSARSLGVPPETTPKVMALKEQLAKAKADAEAEADVYRHLANFFARYYCEGDFLSLRRYTSDGRSTYLIPYDGEEVKLHWANADQYYIKTTENYAAYTFTVDEGEAQRRIHFEISAADNEKDNIKEAKDKKRRFVLSSGDKAITHDHGRLLVRFEHRPLSEAEKKRWPGNGNSQQDKIDRDSTARILGALDAEWQLALSAPAPTEADPEQTLLAKHLGRYTARNSFDYFIHKDLGGFLRRELDLYLKTDVLNLEDLSLGDTDRLRRGLMRMRATRHVGHKIIDFLAQLENFQKKLWLKKKFVLETQWCVTLDRVPEALYGRIAANENQRREWVELLAIDAIAPDLGNGGVGYSEPLTPDFLKANPYLVLDTRHFDRDFKDELLAALSEAGPLDEQTDGLLIHGENFQALNLLKERYDGQVQCVYIDPPYNTDSAPILYKNDLKDSSWLSLMEDRLLLSKELLRLGGILCCAIDDEEVWRLRALLQKLFEKEIGIAPVRSTPIGRSSRGKFSPTHEYSLFYGEENSIPGSLEKTEKQKHRYPLADENGNYAWRNLLRTGTSDLRSDRPKLYYPIYVDNHNNIRIPSIKWNEHNNGYEILEQPRKDEIVVWPIKEQSGGRIEKRWERAWERVSQESQVAGEYRVRRNGNASGIQKISIDFIQRMGIFSPPKTWWDESKYASSNHGIQVIKDLFIESIFDFSKSVALVEDCIRASGGEKYDAKVVDPFAGSGTTGHAVISLNREDGGQRKYILVEMGEHFNTVILPRLKKVVYSPDWKEGKPIAHGNGVSHLIKVMRLESYEDTLDGLVLQPTKDDLFANSPELAEDYRLRYALSAETHNSPCLLGRHFTDPFAYTLSVTRNGARRETLADLPETFNYLLGLCVESRYHCDGVLAITGKDPQKRSCLILWRNLATMDNPALDHWFASNRKLLPEGLDLVYVNGDQTLNTIRQPGETWTAQTIEPLFRTLMLEANEP